MKSSKIYFLGILFAVTISMLFDHLRESVFLVNHHWAFIKAKTVMIILIGIITMYFSMERKSFKIFLIFYSILWSVYGIAKVFQFISFRLGWEGLSKKGEQFSLDYLNFTALFTIVPFIVFFGCFWLITKVLSQEGHSSNN